MRRTKLFLHVALSAVILFFGSVLATEMSAQTLTILHQFGSPGDGYNPVGSLTFDASGNLYGTTYFGPTASICQGDGCGTVFQLKPNGDGSWSESIILAFDGTDGAHPSNPLIFDSQGNLYGTAACSEDYCYNEGVVFELSPGSGGTWTDTTLHNFHSPWEGGSPENILFDSHGNLVGNTNSGGVHNTGTVYTLFKASGWREHLDYIFGTFDNNQDGADPSPAIALDAAGNLYGATQLGGAHGAGVVFELAPTLGRVFWTESLLYVFTGTTDGNRPAGVIFGPDGNLYGTTQGGGAYGMGSVFQLTPNSNGTWTESVIHSFSGASDGQQPTSGVTFDAAGNIYGTTGLGGSGSCNGFGCGTVYKLNYSGGVWSEAVLYRFTSVTGAAYPQGPVTLDAMGNIYGVAEAGGAFGDQGGVAFELMP